MVDGFSKKTNLIDYFDEFIQFAVMKDIKDQQKEKVQNEWKYFKSLLDKISSDPDRIPIYLDILKSKERPVQVNSKSIEQSNGTYDQQTQKENINQLEINQQNILQVINNQQIANPQQAIQNMNRSSGINIIQNESNEKEQKNSSINNATFNSKQSPDQQIYLQQQNSNVFLSKMNSITQNFGSVSSIDQQSHSLQSLTEQVNMGSQQSFQKQINSPAVLIQSKNLLEDSKNKFRYQKDKIKSKVKSILILFQQNNAILNLESDINFNPDQNNQYMSLSKQSKSSNDIMYAQKINFGIDSTSSIEQTQDMLSLKNRTSSYQQDPQQIYNQHQITNTLVRNNSGQNINQQQIQSNSNTIYNSGQNILIGNLDQNNNNINQIQNLYSNSNSLSNTNKRNVFTQQINSQNQSNPNSMFSNI